MEVKDNSKIFINVLNNSKPTPINENYAKIVDSVTKTMIPVFNGKKDLSNVLDESFLIKLEKFL